MIQRKIQRKKILLKTYMHFVMVEREGERKRERERERERERKKEFLMLLKPKYFKQKLEVKSLNSDQSNPKILTLK